MERQEHPNAKLVREGYEAFAKADLAWIDQHLADDITWNVGGNSKWAGAYEGKAKVLDFFGRQIQALGGTPPSLDIHDIVAGDDHVVAIGTASASAGGQSAEWKFAQVFHVRDGKASEVWGLAENDAAVDPFLDSLPG
jgi:ketosteroid isomerase-like protein